jgi:aspartyl-tRNA(Asn)/glutamyl-tRNA(Gln) amidotransferase subunit A
MKLWQLGARATRDGIAAKEFSAREAAESVLARIARIDPKVHAFIEVCGELALTAADECDRRMAAGEPTRPLEGVPIAVKDNMCLPGAKTTCASKMLADWEPPYAATVMEKVLAAGAVPVGKTNLDEFAMGSSTENSGFGPTLNPWDTGRIPGGSSGGSAAAVAAGEAPVALGSDTGGSIRQPASLCGVVGLKPTYGRVSRYGLVAFASSLDQIGPFARDVADAALVAQVISGHDPRDSTSARRDGPDLVGAVDRASVKGVKIGVPEEYFQSHARGGGLAPGVEKAVREAISVLEKEGAEVLDISLPHTEYDVATYYVIATAEASSNLARYDGVHYGHRAEGARDIISLYSRSRSDESGFGDEVKRRIMLGTYALSAGYYDAYYLRALKVRSRIRHDFDEAFEKADLVVCPTSPSVAFRLGERTDDPLQMYLSDICTISANLAGVPAISVPCGTGEDGLPVGVQMMAPWFEEERLFSAARVYEAASGSTGMRPPVWPD